MGVGLDLDVLPLDLLEEDDLVAVHVTQTGVAQVGRRLPRGGRALHFQT